MSIDVYEVQSAGASSGVYNCYKQKLLETAFDAGSADKFDDLNTSPVTVLNLAENNNTYSEPALAAGDRIVGWSYTDCSGAVCIVGMPAVPSVRRAKIDGEPSSGLTFTANLFHNDGSTEIASGLGYNITVYAKVCSGADILEAVPHLVDDQEIFVVNIGGRWYMATVFQSFIDCECYNP